LRPLRLTTTISTVPGRFKIDVTFRVSAKVEGLVIECKNDQTPDAMKAIMTIMNEGYREFRKPEGDEEHEHGKD
jgi:hypothetical protein